MRKSEEGGIFEKKEALKRHIFCICIVLALFACNNALLKNITRGDLNRFFRWYFNDLLCPLFFLSYCQLIFIWIKEELRSCFLLILTAMSAGLVWEYFAPLINPKAVSDPLDLFFYFIGANIYCRMMMKKGERSYAKMRHLQKKSAFDRSESA